MAKEWILTQLSMPFARVLMDKYTVKITDSAISQIKETVNYISASLLEPETAIKWADFLQREISGLSFMPGRYPLIDREPWKSEGIRKMTVKNFLVYYYINENDKTVWITAVVYGRRDQLNVLKDMPLK